MPLRGLTVVDASRMLPGAVLARTLADLGARVIKVEDPDGGDPMRHMPPLVDGTGVGFHTFYRGAESVCLDLATADGAAALRALARHADVLVESFRPGTMERWGVGAERLMAANPSLVVCSLSAFGSAGARAAQVGHDLNFVAASGLLSLLPGEGVPRVQLADVSAGLLACASVLAALLQRSRTQRGMRVEQPLATAVLPFLAWAYAERAAGGDHTARLLGGAAPAYRLYACADGARVALGALEPKFWRGTAELLGLPEHAADGLDLGERGAAAARAAAARFAERPRAEWLALAEARGLPLTAVHDVDAALHEAGQAPTGDTAGPPAEPTFLGVTSARRRGGHAPALGEGTERVLAEVGLQ
jgi:crotonobetainyl-CoA:carnitine CoA-transferase CaiB-like acyl-CoA transferase